MVSRDGKRRMIRAQRAFWMLITLTSSTSGFAPSRPSSGARRVPFHTTTHYLVPDDTAADGGSPKKSPWHHVSNLIPFRRNRRREEDFSKQKNTRRSSIRSMTTDALTERADDAIFTSGDTNTDFVLDNFQRMGPSDVFPKSIEYPLSTETTAPSFGGEVVSTLSSQAPSQNKAVKELEVLIESPSTNLKPATPRTDAPRSKYEGGPLVKRMTRAWFQNFLTGLIERLSIVPAMDLQVRAAPRGSAMKRLIRGQFRCDASIDFRRVIFRNIRMTGGTLEAKRLTLNVLSFLQQPKVRRYLNQFDIHAHNCTFTQDDLFESSCIRNGLGRLLVRILSNAGVKSTNVQVTAVDIVPSGKISCSGQATTAFGSKVSFEVRSGIGMASRGHIVTFPGLEVSLGPALGVFMPVVPDINLDIGHNARLREVHVDGRRRRVTLSASTTVTPAHTIKLNKYSQPKDSYSAQFNFDVGQWVTNLGNFSR